MPSVARSRSASASTTTPFLPPSSSDTRLSRRPARSAMPLPVTDDPVNEMTAMSGLSTMASPTSAPEPVTRLTTPGGKPASAISSTRSVAQCGRIGRRLEHDRVPGHEGGHRLPARDRHREVPGRDDAGHAQRLADAHRPLVGQLGRDRVAGHPATLARHQVGDVDAFLDIAAGLGQDLAHLAGHRPREPLLVLGHERPERVQDLATLGGGRPAPHREGRLGRLDRHRDIGLGPLLEAPDDVARVGRVPALERGARGGIAPLPGDEVAERGRLDGGLGHDRECTPQVMARPPPVGWNVAQSSQPLPDVQERVLTTGAGDLWGRIQLVMRLVPPSGSRIHG